MIPIKLPFLPLFCKQFFLYFCFLTFHYLFLCSVDSTEENTKTPLKKIKDNTALLWRTLRIAVPFYLAVMILCSIGWLEPQCCDLQNNYKWSFALGLRYMNGPPPT